MIIEIDKSVFFPVESGCSFKEFQTLLNVIVLHDGYSLKLIDPSILGSPYYTSLSQLDQQIVDESFDATINASLSTDSLIRPNGSQYYTERIYSVQEGLIYLSSPMSFTSRYSHRQLDYPTLANIRECWRMFQCKKCFGRETKRKSR